MATKRATILAALQTKLKTAVTSVSNRVYLPWDNPPDIENAPYLQINIESSSIDVITIGQWQHTIPIKIGAVITGKFDYPATWDVLQAAASAIASDASLGGACQRIEFTGGADQLTVAGDKVLWPHLAAEIVYLTAKGNL